MLISVVIIIFLSEFIIPVHVNVIKWNSTKSYSKEQIHDNVNFSQCNFNEQFCDISFFFIYKEEITVSEDGKEKTEEGTSTKIAKGITVGE